MNIFLWFLETVMERCRFFSGCSRLTTFWKIWPKFLVSIILNKYIIVIDCKLEFDETFENIYHLSFDRSFYLKLLKTYWNFYNWKIVVF